MTKEEDVKRRVERILEFAEAAADGYGNCEMLQSHVDVYSITLATIENTRNLIDAGYTLKLDHWEDIILLEKRLKAGDHIYYIREANSGDGYGDFYIYCEDGAKGINGVASTTDGVEVLGGESL